MHKARMSVVVNAAALFTSMFSLGSPLGRVQTARAVRGVVKQAGSAERLAKAEAKRSRRGAKLRKIAAAGGIGVAERVIVDPNQFRAS